MIAANIEDLRGAARRKLPRMFFDYLDGGAFGENALHRNISAWNNHLLEQRILVDVASRDLSTSFLGTTRALPMMLGPVGFSGMFWPDGEVQAARAAAKAGIPYCLSTFSINAIEEVAKVLPPGELIFQLYVFRDRALTEAMLARARAVGVHTLVLTVDTGISSVRERDTRNGFRTASRLSLTAALDLARHPLWCLRRAHLGRPELGNMRGHPGVARGLMAQASYLSANVDPGLTWQDLAWLRDHWQGRIVLKGILSAADAHRAVEAGFDALVVSNHGGRQLDDARASIDALPEIVDAVAGRVEVLLDGGIRRGSHIIKALALGAQGVLIGRSYAYGLAAGGEAGVTQAIDLLRAEFDITLGLIGFSSVQALQAARTTVIRAA